MTKSFSSDRMPPARGRGLVWVLAVACGLSVANLYYIQPLLADIGRAFNISSTQAGIVATLAQLGYALGLLLLGPLGDSHDRGTLATVLLAGVALALIGEAVSPSVTWLGAASLLVGFTTVVPQILVPLAAILAPADRRGRAVGTVMSGLLVGVLSARFVSGLVGQILGWRSIYWIAAGLMIGLLLVLRKVLPRDRSHPRGVAYAQLLSSLWGLFRSESTVREASILGGLVFAAFSIFWVTLAFFLATPPYHYGSGVAGTFGLAGIAGALAASVSGRLADRIDARRITLAALFCVLVAYVVFGLLGHQLWGLALGVILLDLGTQAAHISNQTRILRLNTTALSRFNTIYMVSYFVGGTLGSALGATSWALAGWSGVSAAGGLTALLAIGVWLIPATISGLKRLHRQQRIVAEAAQDCPDP